MIEDTLSVLQNHEEELLKEKDRILMALEEVRSAMEVIRAEREKNLVEGPHGRMTIKDMARMVLAESKDGLTAEEILQKINQTFDVELVRTSLSPQLSRLKQSEFVELDEKSGQWTLTKAGRNSSLSRRLRSRRYHELEQRRLNM